MILFENTGAIDMRAAITLGASIKQGSNPIGLFGTGAKYAIAVILREGGKITVFSGRKKHEFTTARRKIRGQPFKMIMHNGQELQLTTDYGKTWAPWQAFRELYSNVLDEGGSARHVEDGEKIKGEPGTTRIYVEGAGMDDLLANKADIFLEGEPLYRIPGVDVFAGESNLVYYRGLRAHEIKQKARFTYSLTQRTDLTEDRTIKYGILVPGWITKAIVECDHAELIEAALTAQDGFEHTFDYKDAASAKISKTFLRVASRLKAENAIRARGAVQLFTQAARTQEEFVGEFYVEPTIVEREIIEEAKGLLLSRIPNLVFPYARVMKGGGRDEVSVRSDRMDIAYETLHAGSHELAISLLRGLAAHHSEGSPSEWLADVIVNRVASLRQERKEDNWMEAA
jgi:hypothetical protein